MTQKQIDREFLRQYYHDLVDELEEIFEIFVEETPKEISQLNMLFAQNKFREAGQLLHKIIPSFTNVGLPHLSAQLKQVERQLDPEEKEYTIMQIQKFEAEFNEYMPDILNELGRLRNLHAA